MNIEWIVLAQSWLIITHFVPCCSDLNHVCWDENQQVLLGQNNPGCIRRDQRDNIGGVGFSAWESAVKK